MRRIVGVAFLLTGLVGCALLGPLNPSQRLLDQARVAVEQRDLETAYLRLAEVRRKYPGSEQAAEAFPVAAAIFKTSYLHDRNARPDSHWVTSAPGFMLDWFVSLLEAPEFPQKQAEALFVGMPYGYFRDYLALASVRPELSRWMVRAEDDNGIIESIVVANGRHEAHVIIHTISSRRPSERYECRVSLRP